MATIRRKIHHYRRNNPAAPAECKKSGKMPRITTKTKSKNSAKTNLQKITTAIIPASVGSEDKQHPKNPIEISNFREKIDFTKKIKLFSLYCFFFSFLLVVFECSLVSIFDIVQGNFTNNFNPPPHNNYQLLNVEQNIVDFTCSGCEVNVQKELP